MAHDALAFLDAMEIDRADLPGFSGMHGWSPEVIHNVGRPESTEFAADVNAFLDR